MNTINSINTYGPLAAFLSSVTWAIGSSSYSKISKQHSAFAVNFARALVALPLYLIAVGIGAGGTSLFFAEFARLEWRHLGWFTLSMVASYGLGDVLFLWSTRSLGVPGALAIASCYPLWTSLIAFFEGEALSFKQVIGLLLTVGGIILVILYGPKAEASLEAPKGISRKGVGVVLAFTTSIMWMLNSVSVSHAGHDVSPAVANSVRMSLGLILSFGFSRIFLPRLSVRSILLPAFEFKKWMWVFIVEGFFGSFLYMYGLSHSPLAIGATLTAVAPVLAVPIAWTLRVEKFSAPRAIGVCIVVTGLCLLVGAGKFL